MSLKSHFGTLLSGKSVKQINYTIINRKRINFREKLRISNRLSIKDFNNDISGHISLPESDNHSKPKGLMHFTKFLLDNNITKSDIYRLLNPIGHIKISKLGTRSIAIILSLYIKHYQTNHSFIKNILKEIIRRFDEFDTSELAHILYSLSGVDNMKYDGLIENFTNRILLLESWDFKFSELAKLLYFSSQKSNKLFFDKCLLHLLDSQIESSNPHFMITSAYLIANSLESLDKKSMLKYFSLFESITNKCIDVLCKFNSNVDEFISKHLQNKQTIIVFDLNINDLETLQLNKLIEYMKICSKIGYTNSKYNTLLNEYVTKLLHLNTTPSIDTTQDNVKNFNRPIHSFIFDYLKNNRNKQYFPKTNDLIQLILHTKPSRKIANEYIKKSNIDISVMDILLSNKQLLHDSFSLNEQISHSLKDNFTLATESNHYGFYKLAKSNGINISTINMDNKLKINILDSLVNEINYNMKKYGDYRFAIIYKDTIYNYSSSLIANNEINIEENIDTISSILTIANDISWSFTLSEARHLLYNILYHKINKITNLPILIKSCVYSLYNTLLKSQLPLFNLNHQTYQLSLLYQLIKHDQCIRETAKELDLEFFSYKNFTININKSQPIGPLVAANWFAKLSNLNLDYEDPDYGLGAYQKIEILGHPLKNHGLDILLSKSSDLINKRYSENEFSKYISDRPDITSLIIENTIKYI